MYTLHNPTFPPEFTDWAAKIGARLASRFSRPKAKAVMPSLPAPVAPMAAVESTPTVVRSRPEPHPVAPAFSKWDRLPEDRTLVAYDVAGPKHDRDPMAPLLFDVALA